MVLLDLEQILSQLDISVITGGDFIVPAPSLFKSDISLQTNSIFSIILLNQTNVSYVYKYKKVENVSDYLTYDMVDREFYVPDSNGSNILNLTNNDLSYIDDLNNGNTDSSITPDSDFLLAHKDLTYNPNTTLGKIVKLIKSVNTFNSVLSNSIVIV